MQPPIAHKISGQNLWLSAAKAIFWEEEKALIVSDLHLGKTGHFRKAGIAVPQTPLKEDMQRLVQLLQHFSPRQLIVVGDFFHSKANLELDFFRKWRNDLSHLPIKLVRGNHDILKDDWYRDTDIEVIEERLDLGAFSFMHDHCATNGEQYNFCGHLHPGVVINGLGKQSLRFPCFYFAPDHCILPAFGRFTGLANVAPRKEDVLYAVVDQTLIKIQ